uniref:Uncharacterized protein n=1 Tax=Phlebotomus papatasi TaxID=29031 RepID=A0A1B0D643_PHLPP
MSLTQMNCCPSRISQLQLPSLAAWEELRKSASIRQRRTYYQQFFNVDTFMVMDRIASAIIHKRAPSTYLKSQIDANPDLYGPIWIFLELLHQL